MRVKLGRSVAEDKKKVVSSPCVNVCALDKDDICIGCHRSAIEIGRWTQMTDIEKDEVLAIVSQREEKYSL